MLGFWPVLINDFVKHMNRWSGSNKVSKLCVSGDSESQSGLKSFPGLKRKLPEDMQMDDIVSLSVPRTGAMELSPVTSDKKNENVTMVGHNSTLGSKSPCAVEGCLSKGFAGLFPDTFVHRIGLTKKGKRQFT
ncbi:defective in cullin neddylation protein 1 [Cucumis melo var. makuwa]|uniref:Defective in cullin neddylation protein 1 n=1 Tax=Cucumis melo var. makuwa TaxID=1194695 RepID=A0A5D3CXX9_CUCMM|nr:defective in cullin neddylation protein 1 [Cucumis melo var. makuwa]TYK15246.1 defective in cullin neddylation protein 1 [Cucumis melo var. makuwa]